MSGAIIPDPLAMPLMETRTPSMAALALHPLAKVSVVMMALRGRLPSVLRCALCFSPGSASSMGATSSGSPMTPVEATKTSEARHLRTRATPPASDRTLATPLPPGEGVGVAGVHDDGAREAGPDVSARTSRPARNAPANG